MFATGYLFGLMMLPVLSLAVSSILLTAISPVVQRILTK